MRGVYIVYGIYLEVFAVGAFVWLCAVYGSGLIIVFSQYAGVHSRGSGHVVVAINIV